MIKADFNWDMKPEEIIEIGYRIQTLRQMFNASEGAIRNEIPPRLLGDPPFEKRARRRCHIECRSNDPRLF